MALPGSLLAISLVFLLGGCKKADHFHEELLALPQLELNGKFAYNSSYAPGDTMIINGLLNNNQELTIKVGNAYAQVIDHSRFYYNLRQNDDSVLADRIALTITPEMGIGRSLPVAITCKGVTLNGPSVAILPKTGTGSLNNPLKLQYYADLPYGAVFLPLVNGKGSVYYYSRGSIYQLKDGNTVVVMSPDDVNTGTGGFNIDLFIGGGINPQETEIYFSALSGTDVRLCRFEIQGRALTVLNTTQYTGVYDPANPAKDYYKIKFPFEGRIQELQFIARDIFPDSEGNVYFTLCKNPGRETGTEPYAVAKLDNTGNIAYLFNRVDEQSLPLLNGPVSVPGIKMPVHSSFTTASCIPDDKRLYVLIDLPLLGDFPKPPGGYDIYDLENKVRLTGFTTNTDYTNPAQVFGPFEALHYRAVVPETAFGFMPYPGEKMIALLYPARSLFHEFEELSAWTMVDIGDQRNYVYAPGRCDQNGYFFDKTDKLLNYDNEGNLYMTSGGQVIKTIQN